MRKTFLNWMNNMKKRAQSPFIILIAILFVCLAACSKTQTGMPDDPLSTAAPASPAEASDQSSGSTAPDTAFQGLDTPWDDRSIFRAGLVSAAQDALDGLEGASVYHIDFQISDDFLQLEGWEEVHYTNQESEPLEAVYFQLTVLIGALICIPLLFVFCIGVFLAIALGIANIIFVILAALEANKGVYYRYPYAIRFIK